MATRLSQAGAPEDHAGAAEGVHRVGPAVVVDHGAQREDAHRQGAQLGIAAAGNKAGQGPGGLLCCRPGGLTAAAKPPQRRVGGSPRRAEQTLAPANAQAAMQGATHLMVWLLAPNRASSCAMSRGVSASAACAQHAPSRRCARAPICAYSNLAPSCSRSQWCCSDSTSLYLSDAALPAVLLAASC